MNKKRICRPQQAIAPNESGSRINIYFERGMKQYLQLCNFSTIAADEAVDQGTQARLCSPLGGGFLLTTSSKWGAGDTGQHCLCVPH